MTLVMEVALKASKKEKPWILDNGFSSHMIGDSKVLKKVVKYDRGTITFGNYGALKIDGINAAEIGAKKTKIKESVLC
jgi:hypothetical protein